MPYKKGQKRGAKKAPRKKYNKRKAKFNKPSTTIVKSPGFSDTMYVRLKYAEEIRLFSGVTSYFTYTFRANSCYDPNYTAGGHQPMYFDQYSAIYSRYRVLGSAIKINAINSSATSASNLVLQSGTDHSVLTDLTTLLEQSRSHIARTIPIAQRYPMRIKSYVSTRKACGLNKKQVFDEDYSAAVTGNPNQIWYHNIMASSVDGSTAIDVRCMVLITYYVQFFDRVIQSQS